MKNPINTNKYYKPKQLKLPLEIEKIIEISVVTNDKSHIFIISIKKGGRYLPEAFQELYRLSVYGPFHCLIGILCLVFLP